MKMMKSAILSMAAALALLSCGHNNNQSEGAADADDRELGKESTVAPTNNSDEVQPDSTYPDREGEDSGSNTSGTGKNNGSGTTHGG